MGAATRTADEVAAISVRALGLDEEGFGLDYPEAIAASVRRAASFLCPTTPRALADAIIEALAPVLPEPPSRDDLMTLIDQLISGGDLLEMADATSDRQIRLLYLGPPSFVPKPDGRYLLTGIRPHGAALVPADVDVEPEAHTRTALLDAEGAEARLCEAGLHRIRVDQWIGQPAEVPARRVHRTVPAAPRRRTSGWIRRWADHHRPGHSPHLLPGALACSGRRRQRRLRRTSSAGIWGRPLVRSPAGRRSAREVG